MISYTKLQNTVEIFNSFGLFYYTEEGLDVHCFSNGNILIQEINQVVFISKYGNLEMLRVIGSAVFEEVVIIETNKFGFKFLSFFNKEGKIFCSIYEPIPSLWVLNKGVVSRIFPNKGFIVKGFKNEVIFGIKANKFVKYKNGVVSPTKDIPDVLISDILENLVR